MSTIRTVIGEARLCYIHLDEPWAPVQGSKDKGKYCITALIPKTDQSQVQAITEALQKAYAEGVAGPWNGKKPPVGYWHNPLQDGDGPKSDGAARGHEFDGHLFLTARTLSKPEIYDSSRTLSDHTIIYPGCYGYISITLKPYCVGGNCGISAFLNAVMKTKDGQNLASPGFNGGVSKGTGVDFIGVPVATSTVISEATLPEDLQRKPKEEAPLIQPESTLDISGLSREDLESMLRKLTQQK